VANIKTKKNKVFKSLYEVKDKYFPHADLEFLESRENDLSREAFTQMLKKIVRPIKQVAEEKKLK
jgi:hypothetical protein